MVDGLGVALAASDNLVMNTVEGHVVTVLGVAGLVVVHTPDATLVTTLAGAEQVKALVGKVAEAAGPNYV